MNTTTFRSAGQIDASRAAAIRNSAICILGDASRQTILRNDGSSVELIRLPSGSYQLRNGADRAEDAA